MPKTRRTKQNRSPGNAFRNARPFIVEKGDMIRTKGVRGRTKVIRVTDANDKRVTSVRSVAVTPQVAAKPVGDRQPKGIFVGRVYTGVARGKAYPYRGVKRGAVVAPPLVPGFLGGLAKAAKRVMVGG